MNFLEALQAAKDGKSVKRKRWVCPLILTHGSEMVATHVENALATDWEIVEAKNRLRLWICDDTGVLKVSTADPRHPRLRELTREEIREILCWGMSERASDFI